MSETKERVKHTPGPWHVERDDDVVSPDGVLVATAFGSCPGVTYDPESAAVDARLIAAAPELLDALKTAVDNDGDLFDREAAIAAIEKAEGR